MVKHFHRVSKSDAATKLANTEEVYIDDLFATNAELVTGTETEKAVTPANVTALTASATQAGIIELATSAEVIAQADTARAVTPAGLAAMLANLVIATFTGHNDAGACTLTGATTDSVVLSIANISSMGITPTSDFETAISVADQIQQSATDNNSAVNYVCILAPKA